MRTFFWAVAALWSLTLGCSLTCRAEDEVRSYALIVGSNEGGPGQGRLSFAQGDAARVADVLSELGRTPRANMLIMREPRVRDVESAFADLRARIAAHVQAGEPSQLLFYYSGHARAHALSLGQEELSLVRLRELLRTVPTTLTVAVLDACQSGAFSGVKGAKPAANFSVSSVSGLHSTGIAVMASSTGTELSQESSELGSSYFTHHLLVALRGGGDGNRDGKVSLDEAYRYAYERTLSDTALTAVGSQHATLETELTGRGDVALTYTVDADARLTLPVALEGRVVVQQVERGTVIAEVLKESGSVFALALPSGRYAALVARGKKGHACDINLVRGQSRELSLTACKEVELEQTQAKGEAPASERWFVEAGVAFNGYRNDGYISSLTGFHYERYSEGSALGVESDGFSDNIEASVGYGLHRFFAVTARYDVFEDRHFLRDSAGPSASRDTETFGWITRAVSVGGRGRLPVLGEWLVAFAELDLGLGFARSELDGFEGDETERDFGVAVRGVGGLTFAMSEHVGGYLAGGYTLANALENLIGDTHDDGGFTLATGLRLRSLKGWW
jgi:hypothetical protein